MPITQEQANQTKPCNSLLGGYVRVSGGAPVPIYCTRPEGHLGTHCDQRDGQPIEWYPNSFTVLCGSVSIDPYPYRKTIDVRMVEQRRSRLWMIEPVTAAGHDWAKQILNGARYVDFPFAYGTAKFMDELGRMRRAGLFVHVVCCEEHNFTDEVFDLAALVDMP